MSSADSTYGFSRRDAREIVAGLGGKEKLIPGQRIGGDIFFAFRLKEPWSSRAAECDIYYFDGPDIVDTGEDKTVYDPREIFASLTTNDYGYCFLQRGKYYTIQAECPA